MWYTLFYYGRPGRDPPGPVFVEVPTEDMIWVIVNSLTKTLFIYILYVLPNSNSGKLMIMDWHALIISTDKI